MMNFEYILGPCKCCKQYTGTLFERDGLYVAYCAADNCRYQTNEHKTIAEVVNEWRNKKIVPVYCKDCNYHGTIDCPYPNNEDDGYCNHGKLNYHDCGWGHGICTAPDTNCPHWQGTFCELDMKKYKYDD